mgnify:CR=1 FL=1
MIYAAGLTYLLMAFIFLVIGIPVYVRARREAEADAGKAGKPVEPFFTPMERTGAAVIALAGMAMGYLHTYLSCAVGSLFPQHRKLASIG